MRENQLVAPKIDVKTLKIEDFTPYSDMSTNCIISDELVSPPHGIKAYIMTPTGTQSIYCVNDRIFTYASDKYIYEYNNLRFTKIQTCESIPKLVPVIIAGQEEILVITNKSSFILGKDQTECTLPYGSCFANYNNRLFIVQNRNIYFSNEFDVENLTMDISNSGYVSVLSQDGDIVALEPYEDKLYVFCQKAIYILNISLNKDFTFTKCNTCALDITANSVARVGSEFYFISNKRLCVFQNGKVEMLKTVFDNCLSNTSFKAICNNQYYALSFSISRNGYVYMFDTINHKAHLLTCETCDFIGGKYLYSTSSRTVYQIDNTIRRASEWTSLPIDFGTSKNKMIMAIDVYSSGDAMLVINGDRGYKTISLKKGNNYKKICLTGKRFYFTITSSNKDVIIKGLQIKKE